MRKFLLAAIAAIVSASSARATITIDVGSFDLLPNTANQIVPVYVSGDEQVTGFNLRAEIGDFSSPDPTPVFQSISFSPAIWDVASNTVVGGPVSGAEQFAEAGVLFDNSGDQVTANGHLLDLTIDTTGITSGNFDLKFSDTAIGVDSAFINQGGDENVPTITNGTINIAVPEPTLLAFAPAVLLLKRRRGCN